METGFLNKHDSEYFSSDVNNYDQSNGFESEGSFFSSLVNESNNEFEEFQWGISDVGNLNDSTLNIIAPETPVHQDDFNRSFNEWQQHISNLKLKEEDDIFSDDKIPDIFPSIGSPRQLTSPLQPLLDESMDPDDLIETLTESSTSPHAPLPNSILPIPNFRIKTEPGTEAYNAPKAYQFKQESVDIAELFNFNLPQNGNDRILPEETSELGPDNYDIVDIKVEKEDNEDDEVDVETVSDMMPVIEANDITSLLDQFEETERFNKMCKHKMKDLDGPKVPPLIIKKTNSQLKVEPAPSPKASPSSLPSPASPFSVPRNAPVNKTIIDSLPKEVIERIKKSSAKKKKIVPVVPAEPLPAKGNEHMKDAGASRSKIRDLINKKKVKTETAQIDHDYCTNDSKIFQENPKVAPGSKKTSVLPPKPPVTVIVDAFSVTEEDKWVLDNEQKLMTTLPTASPSPSEASSNARNSWEKNSKRDSGLESGDVSDASESPSDKKIPLKAQILTVERVAEIKIENEDCPPTPEAASPLTHSEVPNPMDGANEEPTAYDQENEPKKKKLNLDEYRTRRKFARLSSPVKLGTIGEAILSNKWVQRPKEEKFDKEEKKAVVHVEANVRVPLPEIRVDASPKKYEDEKRRRSSRSHERSAASSFGTFHIRRSPSELPQSIKTYPLFSGASHGSSFGDLLRIFKLKGMQSIMT